MPELAALYQVEPSGFVAARNVLVRALRADGRREIAAEVAKLRRPTPAAWGANLLAGQRPELIEAVLAAAAAWQAASSSGERDATQAAQSELRQATGSAVEAASVLMSSWGRPARPDEVEALRSTLQAAAVDEDLAGALRSGTLESTSAGSGFAAMALSLTDLSSDRTRAPKVSPTPAAASRRRSAGVTDDDKPAARRGAPRRAVPRDTKQERQLAREATARRTEQRRLEREATRLETRAREFATVADRAERQAAEARRAADEASASAAEARAAADEASTRLPSPPTAPSS